MFPQDPLGASSLRSTGDSSSPFPGLTFSSSEGDDRGWTNDDRFSYPVLPDHLRRRAENARGAAGDGGVQNRRGPVIPEHLRKRADEARQKAERQQRDEAELVAGPAGLLPSVSDARRALIDSLGGYTEERGAAVDRLISVSSEDWSQILAQSDALANSAWKALSVEDRDLLRDVSSFGRLHANVDRIDRRMISAITPRVHRIVGFEPQRPERDLSPSALLDAGIDQVLSIFDWRNRDQRVAITTKPRKATPEETELSSRIAGVFGYEDFSVYLRERILPRALSQEGIQDQTSVACQHKLERLRGFKEGDFQGTFGVPGVSRWAVKRNQQRP